MGFISEVELALLFYFVYLEVFFFFKILLWDALLPAVNMSY